MDKKYKKIISLILVSNFLSSQVEMYQCTVNGITSLRTFDLQSKTMQESIISWPSDMDSIYSDGNNTWVNTIKVREDTIYWASSVGNLEQRSTFHRDKKIIEHKNINLENGFSFGSTISYCK